MKTSRWIFLLTVLVFSTAQAQFKQPYVWSQSVDGDRLTVEVSIPSSAYLYADRTSVGLLPSVSAKVAPVSHSHTDDFGTADIYEGGQIHQWVYSIDPQTAYQITVKYQGCGTPEGGSAVCYAPAIETFVVGRASSVEEPVKNTPSRIREGRPTSLGALLDRFETVRTDGGMKNAEEFLAFRSAQQKPQDHHRTVQYPARTRRRAQTPAAY